MTNALGSAWNTLTSSVARHPLISGFAFSLLTSLAPNNLHAQTNGITVYPNYIGTPCTNCFYLDSVVVTTAPGRSELTYPRALDHNGRKEHGLNVLAGNGYKIILPNGSEEFFGFFGSHKVMQVFVDTTGTLFDTVYTDMGITSSCPIPYSGTVATNNDCDSSYAYFSYYNNPGDTTSIDSITFPGSGFNYGYYTDTLFNIMLGLDSGTVWVSTYVANIPGAQYNGIIKHKTGNCVSGFNLDLSANNCGGILPISVNNFTAFASCGEVNLAREPINEHAEFTIERQNSQGQWVTIGFGSNHFKEQISQPGTYPYRLRDNEGNLSDIQEVVVDNCSAPLSLYPNPARENCTIRNFPDGATRTLYNTLGQEVENGKTNIVDLFSCTPGMYIVVVNQDGTPVSRLKITKN